MSSLCNGPSGESRLDANGEDGDGHGAAAARNYTVATGDGDGHPNAADLAAAELVLRLVEDKRVAARSRRDLDKHPDPGWFDLAGYLDASDGLTTPKDRLAHVNQWLLNREGRYPAETAAMRSALKRATARGVEDEPDEPDGPPPFSLGLIDAETFFSQDYPVEWLVEGVIVKDEAGGIGGPSKALKTSILIDLLVSGGTATAFLGKFRVPQPRRIALISGESGKRAIQSTFRQVCLNRGLTAADLSNIHLGFSLPQLTNAEHLRVMRKTIEDLGLELLELDPVYLALLAGSSGIDARNMFEMGPLLRDVAETCLGAGCTPLLAHHFTKKREDPFGTPDLGELAYAGFGQFLRQWMLVAPREKFDAEIGLFKLHFCYGGSAGHCGEIAVDIEVGRLQPDFDGRKWVVTIASPAEERAAQQQRRQSEVERKAADKKRAKEAEIDRDECDAIAEAVAALRGEPGRKATLKRLRDLLRWNADKAGRIVARMEKGGMLRPAKVPVPMRGDRTQEYPGFELVEDPEKVL